MLAQEIKATATQNTAPMPIYHDDDDEDERDPHAALVDHVRADHDNHRQALAYLLRYETMVRQQEAEDMATAAHLRPCLERLMEIVGQDTTEEKQTGMDDEASVWKREISYADLRRALEFLEQQGPTEFMTTDRQLMMVMRQVNMATGRRQGSTCLTWAEFVQMYKICISGVMALNHFPELGPMRDRIKDRTLAMLTLFDPQTHMWSSSTGSSSSNLSSRSSKGNAEGLHGTQRSYPFATSPQSANKRRRKRRVWLLMGTTLLLLVAVGGYASQDVLVDFFQGATTTVESSHTPRKNVKKMGKASAVNIPKSNPTFSVRSLVQSSQPSATSSTQPFQPQSARSADLSPDEEAMGLTGPALLVGTVGAPLVAALVRNVLHRLGRGAAVVAATATLSMYGNVLVTLAGCLSLTSLLYRSARAVLQGLGRMRRGRRSV